MSRPRALGAAGLALAAALALALLPTASDPMSDPAPPAPRADAPPVLRVAIGAGLGRVRDASSYPLDLAGRADTMHGIGWGALGAGLATMAGAAHLAGVPTGWFGRALEGAAAENAHLTHAARNER